MSSHSGVTHDSSERLMLRVAGCQVGFTITPHPQPPFAVVLGTLWNPEGGRQRERARSRQERAFLPGCRGQRWETRPSPAVERDAELLQKERQLYVCSDSCLPSSCVLFPHTTTFPLSDPVTSITYIETWRGSLSVTQKLFVPYVFIHPCFQCCLQPT